MFLQFAWHPLSWIPQFYIRKITINEFLKVQCTRLTKAAFQHPELKRTSSSNAVVYSVPFSKNTDKTNHHNSVAGSRSFVCIRETHWFLRAIPVCSEKIIYSLHYSINSSYTLTSGLYASPSEAHHSLQKLDEHTYKDQNSC